MLKKKLVDVGGRRLAKVLNLYLAFCITSIIAIHHMRVIWSRVPRRLKSIKDMRVVCRFYPCVDCFYFWTFTTRSSTQPPLSNIHNNLFGFQYSNAYSRQPQSGSSITLRSRLHLIHRIPQPIGSGYWYRCRELLRWHTAVDWSL